MPTRCRTTTKLLRLFPEELAHITARAEACGLKPARFIREAALGQSRKARHHAETDHLLRALAGMGRRLEQLERLTRTSLGTALAKRVAQARTEQHDLVKRLMRDGRRGPRGSSR